MKKLNYRTIKLEFPHAKECYVAQYKILGIWMSIGTCKNYFTLWSPNTHCNTYAEAFYRVVKHAQEMKRSSQWARKTKKIVYGSDNFIDL